MTRRAITLAMLIVAIGVLGYSAAAARMWAPATGAPQSSAVTVPAISVVLPRIPAGDAPARREASNASAGADNAGTSFHWADAAVGAAATLVLVGMLLAAAFGLARRSGDGRHRPTSAARL